MVTSSETLRELIYQKLVKAEGKIISISEIYEFVNDNCNFDEMDLIPPNLYGKPVKEPRWKRNVRNVLKSESDKNNIIWKGRGLYSYYQLENKKIKSITCNIPSSFVKRNIKLANDRGNGEAKLYIGSVKDKEIFDQFFNNWHPMNTYELNKVDLLLYMQGVELDFSKQSRYKAVSKKLYRELFNKVERLEENRIDLTNYEDNSRYYLRGTSDAWKLIRQTCLPLITTLLIEVKSNNDDGPCEYVVRILRSDEERAPNPTSGIKSKSRKKKTPRKPKQTRIKPMPEDSRTISDDLKDRVWRRDQGMCQANYKLDSRLDKNTGEICGSNENLEFDHIVPFSIGGKTTYRNLQLLCRTHNRIKSDREI